MKKVPVESVPPEVTGRLRRAKRRGLRQPAAAVEVGSLLPVVRSKIDARLLRAARSRLRPPQSGSRLPQSRALGARLIFHAVPSRIFKHTLGKETPRA